MTKGYYIRHCVPCLSASCLGSLEMFSARVVACSTCNRAQWLRGRASDFRLRQPVFESCATVLKYWASFFTLYCSSSLSCINEYLAIDSGDYVYVQTAFRTLIVVCGWMLPRGVEMVSD